MAQASITIKLTPREFDLMREAVELLLSRQQAAVIEATSAKIRWAADSKATEIVELSDILHNDG